MFNRSGDRNGNRPNRRRRIVATSLIILLIIIIIIILLLLRCGSGPAANVREGAATLFPGSAGPESGLSSSVAPSPSPSPTATAVAGVASGGRFGGASGAAVDAGSGWYIGQGSPAENPPTPASGSFQEGTLYLDIGTGNVYQFENGQWGAEPVASIAGPTGPTGPVGPSGPAGPVGAARVGRVGGNCLVRGPRPAVHRAGPAGGPVAARRRLVPERRQRRPVSLRKRTMEREPGDLPARAAGS